MVLTRIPFERGLRGSSGFTRIKSIYHFIRADLSDPPNPRSKVLNYNFKSFVLKILDCNLLDVISCPFFRMI